MWTSTHAALTRRATVSLPANVQYVWPHASRRFLYAATSDSASGMGPAGNTHHVTALGIDPASGALSPHGAPISLPTRPIHMATDIPSQFILVAFNNPSAIRVYRINADGTPGEEVAQPGPIDAGIFAHQVRATPDNRQVILVTRGHDAADGKPEEPGALKVFDFKDGVLSNEVSVAPGGGYGFGPRHLDFHPSKPWVYVSLERQNALDMFELANGALSPTPRFRKNALGSAPVTRQAVGTVHVHPNGRTVYVANRASNCGWREFAGGLYDRPGDRRAAPDRAHRHARHPSAHLPHRSQRAADGGCAHHGGGALAVPHRRGRRAALRARLRYRCRATHHVVDGHGGTRQHRSST